MSPCRLGSGAATLGSSLPHGPLANRSLSCPYAPLEG